MKKKLIGFDFDGVLIDSYATMEKAWINTCKEFKIDTPFSKYKLGIGKPFEVIIRELGLGELLPEIKICYFNFTSEYDYMIKEFDKTIESINFLKSRKYKTAIITSKPKERTEFLLNRFSIKSDLILCPEDCSRGKPNPEPLFIAQEYFNLRSDQCLYIGDMNSDYLCAKRADWEFIYAGWGYGELDKEIDVLKCQSPAILYEYIKDNYFE